MVELWRNGRHRALRSQMNNSFFSTKSLRLESFKGSLELLLQLVRREELDILGVSILQVLSQSLEEELELDEGAELLAAAASMLNLKSRRLLPTNQETEGVEEEDPVEDPQFNIIHQLIDYYQFREKAKELSKLEQERSSLYYRGWSSPPEAPSKLGIEHLGMKDLEEAFQQALARAQLNEQEIQEEPFQVSDKLLFLKQEFARKNELPVLELFLTCKSKLEMIVLFLAILESMKRGILAITKSHDNTLTLSKTLPTT